MKRILLKTLMVILWTVVSCIVLAAALIVLNETLSKHDNLTYGIERISGITGYPLTEERVSLILHKSNQSDSIVMIHDLCRQPDEVRAIMEELVAADERWQPANIAQKDAYLEVVSHLAWGFGKYEHFRPVCDIQDGAYDYIFVDNPQKRDTCVSLVDVDTSTIILYIYLH